MDKIIQNRLFYDFYGELLTKHQQEVLDLYYDEDLSLAEIADRLKLSRQGVYDIIKRSNQALKNYEKTLGLVSNEIKRRDRLNSINGKIKRVLKSDKLNEESKKILKESIQELEKIAN